MNQKKVIMIGGVKYYECNGAVMRVRDDPEFCKEMKDKAAKNWGAAFKEDDDASDSGN